MHEYGPSSIVRRGTKDDASSIALVLLASFAEYEAFYTPEAFAATISSEEQICQRMNEGPLWVALQQGIIVGNIAAVLKNKDVYVRGMAILPDTRGKRLGRQLLEQVEEFASHQGAERLFLSTTPFLTRAISLYEHFGFRCNDEGPHTLFGTPLFTMEKRLKTGNVEEKAGERRS